jgi:hypothetical protein
MCGRASGRKPKPSQTVKSGIAEARSTMKDGKSWPPDVETCVPERAPFDRQTPGKEHKFSQRRACECVPADRAAERRALILRDIYRKYDSERVDVGAALAAKADTPKLFAGVLTRLVDKFPAIIRLPNLDAAQAQAQNRLDMDNLDVSSLERPSHKREDADFDANDIFETDRDL